MPAPFDHGFVVFLVLLFPIRARSFGYRRLERASLADVPRVRRALYREAIALQWSLTAIVVIAWGLFGRAPLDLGVAPRFDAWTAWLPAAARTAFPWVVVIPAATLVLAVLLLATGRSARRSDEALERVREQLRDVERLMPADAQEFRLFLALSITAGVCEELLFRGYLLWYFGAFMDAQLAALVSSVLFGLGHLYQGPRGVLKTAFVGLVFAMWTIMSGSILPAIVLHALLDAHSGSLAWFARRRQQERALAEAGPPSDPQAVGEA